MGIVLTRIDNRLIHGQVLEAWVPSIRANCIVVANDQVAGRTFQKVLMETAVPKGIRVKIVPLAELHQTLVTEEVEACRVLLLFASSADALEACRLGVNFDRLNLGNMHGGEGKMRLTCTIALDPEDIDNLTRIEAEGVQISSQCIPSDRRQDWRKLIRNAGS